MGLDEEDDGEVCYDVKEEANEVVGCCAGAGLVLANLHCCTDD